MAEDTVAFMQAIGVGRPDLIGWSDGGNIALDLAINHPERIGRMAITGANFRVDGFAPEVIEWIKQVKPGGIRPSRAPEVSETTGPLDFTRPSTSCRG